MPVAAGCTTPQCHPNGTALAVLVAIVAVVVVLAAAFGLYRLLRRTR